MPSNLRFVITSVFENTGFKEAAVGLGVLTGAIVAVVKKINLLKLAGRILTVVTLFEIARAGIKAVRAIADMAPAAAEAEISINRLRTQLNLLGLAAKDSIIDINDFARDTAAATKFTADEVRSAVAESVRRTGDVEGALRRVAIAQDIAAVTGQSLQRSIRQVALAEQGRVRSIQLITNLSRQELVTAARRGELLDVLEKKFRGAAEAEANTLRGLQRRLDSVNRDTRRTLGALALPFRKFGAGVDLEIGKASNALTRLVVGLNEVVLSGGLFKFGAENNVIKPLLNIAQAALRSGDVLTAVKNAIDEASASSIKVGDKTTATQEQISEEAEFLALSIGKTNEELRELRRKRTRAILAIKQATRLGTRSLKTSQKELLDEFVSFSSQLRQIVAGEADVLANAKLNRDRAIRELASERSTFAVSGNIAADAAKERDELERVLRDNKFSEREIRRILGEDEGSSAKFFEKATAQSKEDRQSQRAFKQELVASGIVKQSIFEAANDRLQNVLEDISAAVSPAININFNLQPAALRGQIIAIADQAVRNFLNQQQTSDQNASRQKNINASIE